VVDETSGSSSRRRVAGWVLFVSLIAVVLSACAGASQQPARVSQNIDRNASLTIGIITSPSQWDPHKGRSMTVDYQYMGPIYDRLLFLKGDLSVGPMLATSYQLSPDKMALTLKLRTDVKFHDGTPFNAEAVVANLKYAKTLTGYPSQNLLKIVKDVVAVDPATARIDLNSDGTNFPTTLATYISVSGMASPLALQAPEKLATVPAGSGPYKLVEQRADRAVYQRVAGYWDPVIDKRAAEQLTFINISNDNARVAALQSGQIDAMGVENPIPGINQIADGKTIVKYRTVGTHRRLESVYNYKNPLLQKPEVREALSLALDRTAIADQLMNGECAATLQSFGKGAPGYSAEAAKKSMKPDLARAKQLLAQAGAPNPTFNALVNTSALLQNLATAMQAQWAQVGVKLQITSVPPDQGLARWASGSFDVFISVNSGAADPSGVVDLYYTTGGTYTQGTVPQELTDMTSKARLLPLGSSERDKAYQAISTYMVEHPVSAVVCNYPTQFLHRTHVVGFDQYGYAKLQTSLDGTRLAVLKH
jgi:peptide/nickel transport system substrate-binding protein